MLEQNFWSDLLDPLKQEVGQLTSQIKLPPVEMEIQMSPKTVTVLYVTAGILFAGLIGSAVIRSRGKK